MAEGAEDGVARVRKEESLMHCLKCGTPLRPDEYDFAYCEGCRVKLPFSCTLMKGE